jgi:iron complex outermembrane receptor protein
MIAQAYLDYTTREQIPLQDERISFDLDIQYELPDLGRHDVVAGARYRRTSVELDDSAIVIAADASLEEDLHSAFIQDRITLAAARWYLTIGSKFDQNDFTGFEVQPNVRLQWLDGELQSAWASLSRAVRTPSELERELRVVSGVIPPGLFAVPISVEPVPSPDFESEELVAFEIGYRRRWSEDFVTDLTTFYNEYDGLATLSLMAPELGADPPHIILPIGTTNMTDGRVHGFEAAVNWRARENVSVSAAYSYLDLELHGPPSALAIDAEVAEGAAPRNLANVRVAWDINPAWSADAALYYSDALPAFPLDASLRLDARICWRITPSATLELIGQGLLDEEKPEFGAGANSIAVERSVFGRLTWRG